MCLVGGIFSNVDWKFQKFLASASFLPLSIRRTNSVGPEWGFCSVGFLVRREGVLAEVADSTFGFIVVHLSITRHAVHARHCWTEEKSRYVTSKSITSNLLQRHRRLWRSFMGRVFVSNEKAHQEAFHEFFLFHHFKDGIHWWKEMKETQTTDNHHQEFWFEEKHRSRDSP